MYRWADEARAHKCPLAKRIVSYWRRGTASNAALARAGGGAGQVIKRYLDHLEPPGCTGLTHKGLFDTHPQDDVAFGVARVT